MNFTSDFELTNGTYLLNHSVGKPLRTAANVLQSEFLAPWQNTNKEPWNQWLSVISKFNTGLSQLFNSSPEQFCPQANLSSGLTKLLMSLPKLSSQSKVLMSENDFPSMGFVIQKALPQGAEIVYIPKAEDITNLDTWEKYIKADIDLVFVSHVYSNTGQQAPIKGIVQLAKMHKVISIIDVAQSAGVLPINLAYIEPDFMVGSSVKWLCGGPGTAYLWLAKQHIEKCEPIDVGWFSHQNPFEFDIHNFDYHNSALRFWGGTPSILPFVLAANSIEYFADKVHTVREHNLTLQNKLIEYLPEFIASPFDAQKRSGTIILDFLDNHSVLKQLTGANIAVDLRECGLRVSPHIYNNEEDIDSLVSIIRDIKS